MLIVTFCATRRRYLNPVHLPSNAHVRSHLPHMGRAIGLTCLIWRAIGLTGGPDERWVPPPALHPPRRPTCARELALLVVPAAHEGALVMHELRRHPARQGGHVLRQLLKRGQGELRFWVTPPVTPSSIMSSAPARRHAASRMLQSRSLRCQDRRQNW